MNHLLTRADDRLRAFLLEAPGRALREREHDAQRRAEQEQRERARARRRPGKLAERAGHEHERERRNGTGIKQQAQRAPRRLKQKGAQAVVGAGQQVIHGWPPDGRNHSKETGHKREKKKGVWGTGTRRAL